MLPAKVSQVNVLLRYTYSSRLTAGRAAGNYLRNAAGVRIAVAGTPGLHKDAQHTWLLEGFPKLRPNQLMPLLIATELSPTLTQQPSTSTRSQLIPFVNSRNYL